MYYSISCKSSILKITMKFVVSAAFFPQTNDNTNHKTTEYINAPGIGTTIARISDYSRGTPLYPTTISLNESTWLLSRGKPVTGNDDDIAIAMVMLSKELPLRKA